MLNILGEREPVHSVDTAEMPQDKTGSKTKNIESDEAHSSRIMRYLFDLNLRISRGALNRYETFDAGVQPASRPIFFRLFHYESSSDELKIDSRELTDYINRNNYMGIVGSSLSVTIIHRLRNAHVQIDTVTTLARGSRNTP
ncbi:hypothetical protein EVAR_27139_1 [Eumeta japonica]|uniref:Uncharacterized protein n=1 Tax=Eumeta variegata TaxID=151549 RepID=A0A4C1VYS6_EUMVA|nr:hypothetical protein EVAR_27139_1 [Eumeta japonica]